MKLLATVAFAATVAADERAFANQPDFISAQEPWWYNKWWAGNDKPDAYLANTEGAIAYFKNHVGSDTDFGNKLESNLQAIVRKMRNFNTLCYKKSGGKPVYAERMAEQARKRRGRN